MPWPKTLGRPAAWALTSSWCMGLKSPDAPAYCTRSVRVSSWVATGPSSPSLTSSKYSFCSAIPGVPPDEFSDARVTVYAAARKRPTAGRRSVLLRLLGADFLELGGQGGA